MQNPSTGETNNSIRKGLQVDLSICVLSFLAQATVVIELGIYSYIKLLFDNSLDSTLINDIGNGKRDFVSMITNVVTHTKCIDNTH